MRPSFDGQVVENPQGMLGIVMGAGDVLWANGLLEVNPDFGELRAVMLMRHSNALAGFSELVRDALLWRDQVRRVHEAATFDAWRGKGAT